MDKSTVTPTASGHSLVGRTLYIPRMSDDGAALVAATYRSFGINGTLVPESDATTLDLARQYTNGDECYPELVTLGGFLKITESPDFVPERTAFFMPTANGPCRFGQYEILLNDLLEKKGLPEVMVVSPTSANGYDGVGGDFARVAWWCFVCGDGLRKLLLQTRPYEETPGETDRVHGECLDLLCGVIERQDLESKDKLEALVAAMTEVAERFSQIPARYTTDRPLIGVVGEIYCRLDSFTNASLIRRIEKFGGEVWLANMSEWVFFVNFMERLNRRASGGTLSKAMLRTFLRDRIQRGDEHRLMAPLHERLRGYEEAESTAALVEPATPYLPYWGAQGEMVLSVGGVIYLHGKGADGMVDISPFSCMNGIICEAVYPRVGRDFNNMPVRIFYFDGTEGDHDRDVEIFLELANTYKRRKKVQRVYPDHFTDRAQQAPVPP